MQIDVSFLPTLAAAFLLTFARIGTMVMLLPGLGDMTVPSRVRLSLALVLTAVLLPAHEKAYAVDIRTTLAPAITLLIQEILVGIILGMTARLAMSCLQVAGTLVAQNVGLGFVTAVDPTQNQQGALLGNFLTIVGVALIFTTDLHYLVIIALNDSYNIFKPGELPLTGDVAQHITQVIGGSFRIGLQLAAPFIAFGMIFHLGLGVLSRLMPQMQVFFIGLPLSIILGLLMFTMVIGAMMGTFVSYFEGVLASLAFS